jgi:hypothetical protein
VGGAVSLLPQPLQSVFCDGFLLSTMHVTVASVDRFGENLWERNHLEDLGIDSRILLK